MGVPNSWMVYNGKSHYFRKPPYAPLSGHIQLRCRQEWQLKHELRRRIWEYTADATKKCTTWGGRSY